MVLSFLILDSGACKLTINYYEEKILKQTELYSMFFRNQSIYSCSNSNWLKIAQYRKFSSRRIHTRDKSSKEKTFGGECIFKAIVWLHRFSIEQKFNGDWLWGRIHTFGQFQRRMKAFSIKDFFHRTISGFYSFIWYNVQYIQHGLIICFLYFNWVSYK